MPDTRVHRGPHPDDARLFAPDAIPALRQAVTDLSWLEDRGYNENSALNLVGDRYRLNTRQRTAVMRCACAESALGGRRQRELPTAAIRGQILCLDGFNILLTIEAALSGGLLLEGRDGCLRDLASMHGSYRKVTETATAIQFIGETAVQLEAAGCAWFLDRPVSNSGRLKTLILETAASHGWNWEVTLIMNPDPVLAQSDDVVVTADSVILDRCRRWFNLGRKVVRNHIPAARILMLG